MGLFQWMRYSRLVRLANALDWELRADPADSFYVMPGYDGVPVVYADELPTIIVSMEEDCIFLPLGASTPDRPRSEVWLIVAGYNVVQTWRLFTKHVVALIEASPVGMPVEEIKASVEAVRVALTADHDGVVLPTLDEVAADLLAVMANAGYELRGVQ